jgi:hypothetical protein
MDETEYPLYTNPLTWVWVALQIASLVHVFRESSRDKRIGNRWWHVGMNLLVCWPLPYLGWIFWWPGSLRQAMSGSDRDKAHRWARNLIEERTTETPNNRHPISGSTIKLGEGQR